MQQDGRESIRSNDVSGMTLARLDDGTVQRCVGPRIIQSYWIVMPPGCGHRAIYTETSPLPRRLSYRCCYCSGLLTYCLTTRIGLVSTRLGMKEGDHSRAMSSWWRTSESDDIILPYQVT